VTGPGSPRTRDVPGAELAGLLGDSAPMAAVREQAARLLRSAAGAARRLPPVLILGETGTGKGLLAGALHRAGGRAGGPFVDVNCAAIPETLLEAELFGFERGAFTDARQAKAGLFQAAGGGTIFLDEVGLLPLGLQAKLLRVLEERSVRRLGSTRNEPLDVGIVAATSEDLSAAVAAGRFRADLYHRLAVVTFVMPPLRDRGRDVLLLADHFLAQVGEEYGLPARVLTEDARAALLAHGWPGNVRELANVLERAALLAEGPRLTAAALGLPAAPAGARPGAPAGSGAEPATDPATERERDLVLEVLRDTGWNFTRAAARLGLPRNTLRYRVERLGLAPEGPPGRRRGGRPRRPARPAPAAATDAVEGRRVMLLRLRVDAAAVGPAARDGSRALEEGTAKVRSFGGHIAALGPDELLAAFGLEPDEDAPRRAAHAGLALAAAAARARAGGLDAPALRVALHAVTLPAAPGGPAAPDPRVLAAAGPLLDGLLAAAAPDSVVASGPASRFLARRFELLPLAAAAGAAAGACRLGRPAEPGRTPFVGRERELRLLAERFAEAEAGRGQVVSVVGEAGIGKSRLLHELRRRLGRRATWVEGQALSFGRAMPFHPVIDMLRRVFHIDDTDRETLVAEKIARAVQRLGPELEDTQPFLRYLLSIDPGDPAVPALEPHRRQEAIVRATHRLFERGAELRPHVLVLEDLHWCDPATEVWITRLAEGIAAKRAMVVLTHRPGYRPAFGSHSFHTTLALSTLSDEDSLRIAEALLGGATVPAALRALVLDKAEGNPFFIEELLRSLLEQGAVRAGPDGLELPPAPDAATVPDTVEEVLLARIRRLEPPLQQVLAVAAVIGKNVPVPLLRAVAGRGEEALAEDLRRLQAAEFLHEVRAVAEVEYSFKHALTQDVAYARVEPGERRVLHARIASAIESLYPGRLGEHVERLAYHALHGEQWAAAVRYARQAGAKAFDRSANREAVASFEQALAALARLPEDAETLAQAVDVRLAARSALLQLAELGRIVQFLAEAEALAQRLGDDRRLAWVWTYGTIARLFAGEPGAALAMGERALALAEKVGDVALRATARTPLGHACRERGEYARALGLFREAIEALEGDLAWARLGQAVPPSLYARSMAAICLAELGRFAEAERLAGEAAALTERLELPFGLALARVAQGHARIVQGRPAEAAAILEPALALIEARGLPTWRPWAAALRGYALALTGQARPGVALMQDALARAAALPFLFGHSQWVAWLAHARLAGGEAEAARRHAAEALATSRQRGEEGYRAWALWSGAEVDAADGPAGAAARAAYDEALALAGRLGMRPLAARCHAGLGRLDGEDAPAHREAAARLRAELGMPSG
jgi:DNA-binding NtrC family response regulator/tetratricopeptide (TPR) repeat protein